MTTEAEIRMMGLQVKECWQSPEAGRVREWIDHASDSLSKSRCLHKRQGPKHSLI